MPKQLPEMLATAIRDATGEGVHGFLADDGRLVLPAMPVWFEVAPEAGRWPRVYVCDAADLLFSGEQVPGFQANYRAEVSAHGLAAVLIAAGWTVQRPEAPVVWGDYPRKKRR